MAELLSEPRRGARAKNYFLEEKNLAAAAARLRRLTNNFGKTGQPALKRTGLKEIKRRERGLGCGPRLRVRVDVEQRRRSSWGVGLQMPATDTTNDCDIAERSTQPQKFFMSWWA